MTQSPIVRIAPWVWNVWSPKGFLATTTSTSSSTSTSTSTTSTSSSTSSSSSTTTTLAPAGGNAIGEEFPLAGETPISWQTMSDGAGGIPTVIGDQDWGQMELDITEEGRSIVWDFGNGNNRLITITENRYQAGQGTATMQIRGQAGVFLQDDVGPAWENYVAPIAKTWRFIQLRAIKQS